jgi:hypothetical protein
MERVPGVLSQSQHRQQPFRAVFLQPEWLQPVFFQIQHQAFSQHRVEQPVQKPRNPWFFHDVPGEKSVVEVDRKRIGSGGAHEAFEPPVGGVDAVGVVMIEKAGAGPLQPVDQVFFAVDAHMALVGIEIIVGQGPADAFGQVAGHADHQRFSRFEHPDDFAHGLAVIRDVFQYFAADHQVEACVGKGQAGDVGRGKAPVPPPCSPSRSWNSSGHAGFLQIVRVEVCTGHLDALQPIGRTGMAA